MSQALISSGFFHKQTAAMQQLLQFREVRENALNETCCFSSLSRTALMNESRYSLVRDLPNPTMNHNQQAKLCLNTVEN